MVIHSFAKINLFLQVINKRPDNYHNLKTVFERISLKDSITLKNRRDNLIKIKCGNKNIPKDENNLCFKAAKILRSKFCPFKGVDISITKRIPIAAGLGGGSSNAAAVLLGLNRLWGLKLPKIKLAEIAGKIGSDVAFFVYEVPFAFGYGRGEKIKPLNNLRKVRLWHLLVVPKIHVSTPLIYKHWDNLAGLTKPLYNVKIFTSALARNNLVFKPGLLFNSLEQVTISQYSKVGRVKEALLKLELSPVLMSGSGPAVFALLLSGEKALRLAKVIRKTNKSWRVFAVKTV
ncbi:MAG: 4-(cytidine 5'-diphospho)-2-C-methyl-D-erythritol kinase [Candidatus Omnitrophica bacterium]|nr:4-(cytidine 5'-diphospho)-2-C-methyl-D-erythritol kinase [Candidatus Omnitrophota bacterium]